MADRSGTTLPVRLAVTLAAVSTAALALAAWVCWGCAKGTS